MIRSLFSFIGSLLGVHKQTATKKRSAMVDNEWKKLVKSDFCSEQLHIFVSKVLAQDLSDEEFAIVIAAGNKDVASCFIDVDRNRGDILNSEKVRLLLEEPDLMFCCHNENGGFEVINDPEVRAIRILSGFSGMDLSALGRLILSGRCALVAIALWAEHIVKNEVLVRAIATAAGYRCADLKKYCLELDNYVVDDFSSIKETDLFVIETLRGHPENTLAILGLKDRNLFI